MTAKDSKNKMNPPQDPFSDNTAESQDNKDHALSPQPNPFRPDLPFDKAQVDKDKQVNRTTEW